MSSNDKLQNIMTVMNTIKDRTLSTSSSNERWLNSTATSSSFDPPSNRVDAASGRNQDDGLSFSLLHMPDELLGTILSFLNFEDISEMRRVCTRFNSICKSLLNSGFIKVYQFHNHCQKHVKSQLPRRESERRNHPLARHSDILSAVETRLSLLCMTFMKYIDMETCCFIPGKVIDETFRVLHLVKNCTSPPRAHELLQELRDISSMAMEHFDEKIVPDLKRRFTNLIVPTTSREVSHSITPVLHMTGPSFSSLSVSTSPGRATFPIRTKSRLPSIRQDISKLQHQMRITSKTAISARKSILEYRKQREHQRRRSCLVESQVVQQSRLIKEQNIKITDQEKRIDELNRKILEYDQKFVDLYAELSHVRDEKLSDVTTSNNKGHAKADCKQTDASTSKTSMSSASITSDEELSLESKSTQEVRSKVMTRSKRSIEKGEESEDSDSESNNMSSRKRTKLLKSC